MTRKQNMSYQDLQDCIRRSDALIANAEQNIARLEAEHAEFLRQRDSRIAAMLSPELETSIEVSGNQFIKNGELILSTAQLMKVIDNPKNIEQIYKESQGITPSTQEDKSEPLQQGRWFRDGNPLPTMTDMLEPVQLAEMLRELG